MSDLNEHLDHAFSAIEPGPAPVAAAMNQGKKIRTRRRAAILAGAVAVIAGAVAFVPALAHHQALPGPSTSHLRVTVNPPGPNSPVGTIATGLIGTRPWNIRIESPGTKNCQVTGNGMVYLGCSGGGLPQFDAADPIAFGGMSGTGSADNSGRETFFVSYGVVRQDVASVRVVLANGTVLTPRPVTLDGKRWVAFANPISVPVTSVTVYSRSGEIATAIPFNGPNGDSEPDVSAWLRPGQAGAARVTKTFASGTANGQAWQMTAYIGPWGTCLEGGGNGGVCYALTTYMVGDTSELGAMSMSPSGTLVWGAAANSVSYLIVTPKNGAAIRVGVTAVGQQKYFAFSLNRWPQKADRWTAYNSAGQPVASGSLS